jgi:pilus assembly protein CpaE
VTIDFAHETSAGMPGDKADGVGEMPRIPQITLHAFCETPEMADTLAKVGSDRRMSRVRAKVHPGGVAAALDMYRQTASPNLIVLESRAAAGDLRAQLDALADVCVSGTKVIVIGYANDVVLYRELLARGVSEYMVAPVEPLAIISVIARLYQESGARKLGRTLAFIGAKGGAGSSTIAQNVASMVGRTYGCDVILADLDLPFGSASLGLNLSPTQGMAQALQYVDRLDQALLERLLTKSEDHLSVLTAPASLESSYDLEESTFERMLDIAQSNVPFVVLDIPHVWTSWTKKTLLAADEVVIAAIPDLVSLRNAKNLVEQLKRARPNDAPPKVVLNQVGMPKRLEIKPDKFAAALQIEPIACIPFDPSSFSAAANNGQMIADVAARSAACMSLAKTAEAITGRRNAASSRNASSAFRRLLRR